MSLLREPMATRELVWHDGNEKRPVLIRVWSPVEFDGEFLCDFAIDGLPEPVRSYARGFDFLDALMTLSSALRTALHSYRKDISWLGERGFDGIPYVVSMYDKGEQRYLEQLVETEIDHYLEVSKFSYNRWQAALRELYDHDGNEPVDQMSTTELVDLLLMTAERKTKYRAEGNEDAVLAFGEKSRAITSELSKRPGYKAIFERLTAVDDRELSLWMAYVTFPKSAAVRALERLRDDGIEPEATRARQFLEGHLRDASRPRPWDDESIDAGR